MSTGWHNMPRSRWRLSQAADLRVLTPRLGPEGYLRTGRGGLLSEVQGGRWALHRRRGQVPHGDRHRDDSAARRPSFRSTPLNSGSSGSSGCRPAGSSRRGPSSNRIRHSKSTSSRALRWRTGEERSSVRHRVTRPITRIFRSGSISPPGSSKHRILCSRPAKGWVIDPHGDLAEELLDHIPRAAPITSISTQPSRTTPIAFNLLRNVAPGEPATCSVGLVVAP